MRTLLLARFTGPLTRLITAAALSLTMGACTTLATKQQPTAGWSGGAGEAAPSAAPYGGTERLERGPSVSASAAAGAPIRAERTEQDAEPAERPGLGTEWGESRYSPVRDAQFERADESPMFQGSLHYNDAPGTEVMRDRVVRMRQDEPLLRYSRGARPRLWGGVSISIVDDSGHPLPAYHLGERVLIVGSAGQRYALKVENRTGQRFELVASVDGLDVVDGKSATLEKRGYVVGPHATLHIDGFRRSFNEVAAFRFGSVKDSYAAQTSEFGARNVGVIGVALFAEQGARVAELDRFGYGRGELEAEAQRRELADPFPGRFAAPPARVIEQE